MTSRANDRDKLETPSNEADNHALSRRNILLGSSALVALAAMTAPAEAQRQKTAPATTTTSPPGRQPNILVIWGDDIGIANISAYSNGLMGYETPNIDRIAREGLKMQHYYGEQSCTAGRSAFLTGQHIMRSGLSKLASPARRWA